MALIVQLPWGIKAIVAGFIVVVKRVKVGFRQVVVWWEELAVRGPVGWSERAIKVAAIRRYFRILRGRRALVATQAELAGAGVRMGRFLLLKAITGLHWASSPSLVLGCWRLLSLLLALAPSWTPSRPPRWGNYPTQDRLGMQRTQFGSPRSLKYSRSQAARLAE